MPNSCLLIGDQMQSPTHALLFFFFFFFIRGEDDVHLLLLKKKTTNNKSNHHCSKENIFASATSTSHLSLSLEKILFPARPTSWL
jgi:hypothetical protein